MAGKNKNVYVCIECGAESAKWYGRCPACGAWNTLEEQISASSAHSKNGQAVKAVVQSIRDIRPNDKQRYHTGLQELDRVLGGGIVCGSLMLLGGDPGIGKSTLLLQICEHLGREHTVLYVSGEESEGQIKLRADRLQVSGENLLVLCENDMDAVLLSIQDTKPDIVIIDSIQTMNLAEIASASGSVTQVRECTSAIMRLAKRENISVFIVGHVNKDGAIAGPKVMEHIVDCVLYFEGDRHSSYRLLRCVKNRFGSTNEIGVFEMGGQGLAEVENPSLMLLSGRPLNVSGACVACTIEGTRPMLAEIQGLVSPTGFGNPRRMATGFDYNRLALILAVLEKRAGYFFSNLDIYVNVVGGLWLDEPAVDLPVALSLISGLKDVIIPSDCLAFGEIGLTGEIRAVSNADLRVSEAVRMGFKRVILPAHNLSSVAKRDTIQLIGVHTVREAFEAMQES
ncbi:MAG: DNA repair protein RadA [Clostridia bacterium]|nr:DNA repair protein RadA [Clostridia bacterium]